MNLDVFQMNLEFFCDDLDSLDWIQIEFRKGFDITEYRIQMNSDQI